MYIRFVVETDRTYEPSVSRICARAEIDKVFASIFCKRIDHNDDDDGDHDDDDDDRAIYQSTTAQCIL